MWMELGGPPEPTTLWPSAKCTATDPLLVFGDVSGETRHRVRADTQLTQMPAVLGSVDDLHELGGLRAARDLRRPPVLEPHRQRLLQPAQHVALPSATRTPFADPSAGVSQHSPLGNPETWPGSRAEDAPRPTRTPRIDAVSSDPWSLVTRIVSPASARSASRLVTALTSS